MRNDDESAERSGMSPGQMAYEERRAAEAGMTLAAWLKRKKRQMPAPEARPPVKATRRKGLLSRLLERAHKPL